MSTAFRCRPALVATLLVGSILPSCAFDFDEGSYWYLCDNGACPRGYRCVAQYCLLDRSDATSSGVTLPAVFEDAASTEPPVDTTAADAEADTGATTDAVDAVDPMDTAVDSDADAPHDGSLRVDADTAPEAPRCDELEGTLACRSSHPDAVWRCEAGVWVVHTECGQTAACAQGACQCHTASQCADGANTRLVCENGVETAIPCPADTVCTEDPLAQTTECALEQLCEPGSFHCDVATNTIQLCGGSGNFWHALPCGGVCTNAATCVGSEKTCPQGETGMRCSVDMPGGVFECLADGTSKLHKVCQPWETCEAGECVAWSCAPCGQCGTSDAGYSCVGSAGAAQCAGTSELWSLVKPCPSGCVEGSADSCLGSCFAVGDRCSGPNIVSCSAAGKPFEVSACEANTKSCFSTPEKLATCRSVLLFSRSPGGPMGPAPAVFWRDLNQQSPPNPLDIVLANDAPFDHWASAGALLKVQIQSTGDSGRLELHSIQNSTGVLLRKEWISSLGRVAAHRPTAPDENLANAPFAVELLGVQGRTVLLFTAAGGDPTAISIPGVTQIQRPRLQDSALWVYGEPDGGEPTLYRLPIENSAALGPAEDVFSSPHLLPDFDIHGDFAIAASGEGAGQLLRFAPGGGSSTFKVTGTTEIRDVRIDGPGAFVYFAVQTDGPNGFDIARLPANSDAWATGKPAVKVVEGPGDDLMPCPVP